MAVVAVAAMLALNSQSAIAAPSDDAMARPDVAQSITKQVTGSTARELGAAETKQGGFTVNHAKSTNGATTRTLVQDHKDGFAVLAVLESGQSSATFDGLVPAGAQLKATKDGGFRIVGSDGTQSVIKAPWAQDATGRPLPTAYTVKGTQVTQTVDTRGAAFPIVADPYVTVGLNLYLHFDRTETININGRLGDLTISTALCSLIPVPFSIACAGLVFSQVKNLIETFANAAAVPGKCAVMIFSVKTSGYAGANVETC